ncbi:MAG TPA: hypothetical protein VFC24_19210 [Casimicrobiaceae bacterium]|nr:hypothetical protein [Casimicrobiaceae bacterium]
MTSAHHIIDTTNAAWLRGIVRAVTGMGRGLSSDGDMRLSAPRKR